MADNNKGGKKGRKIGRDKVKCARYRLKHGGGDNKKIIGSKEHRGCGALGYYLRRKKGTVT